MGVYVKKMKMPDGCGSCDIPCGISDRDKLLFGFDGTRPDNCPLVEIIEPHGRLIDADVALENIDIADGGPCYVGKEGLDNTPTVIEAEGK